jgi:hypothetical protein
VVFLQEQQATRVCPARLTTPTDPPAEPRGTGRRSADRLFAATSTSSSGRPVRGRQRDLCPRLDWGPCCLRPWPVLHVRGAREVLVERAEHQLAVRHGRGRGCPRMSARRAHGSGAVECGVPAPEDRPVRPSTCTADLRRHVGRPASASVRQTLAGGGGPLAGPVFPRPRWGLGLRHGCEVDRPEASDAAARPPQASSEPPMPACGPRVATAITPPYVCCGVLHPAARGPLEAAGQRGRRRRCPYPRRVAATRPASARRPRPSRVRGRRETLQRKSASKSCLWASDRPLRGRSESLRRRDRRVAGAARARARNTVGAPSTAPVRL